MSRVRLIGENFYNPEPRKKVVAKLSGRNSRPVCEEPKIMPGRLTIGRDKSSFQPRDINLGTFTGEKYTVRQTKLVSSLKNEYLSNELEICCKISLPLKAYIYEMGRIIAVYSVNGKRYKRTKKIQLKPIKIDCKTQSLTIVKINKKIVKSGDELSQ